MTTHRKRRPPAKVAKRRHKRKLLIKKLARKKPKAEKRKAPVHSLPPLPPAPPPPKPKPVLSSAPAPSKLSPWEKKHLSLRQSDAEQAIRNITIDVEKAEKFAAWVWVSKYGFPILRQIIKERDTNGGHRAVQAT